MCSVIRVFESERKKPWYKIKKEKARGRSELLVAGTVRRNTGISL